jgi:DNA polymerase-3 subunit alpha
MSGLMKYNLIPDETEALTLAKRVFEFNRYLKAICKGTGSSYMLDERALNFITSLGEDHLLTVYGDNYELDSKEWDKRVYQKHMDVVRNYLTAHKDELLTKLNSAIFQEDWNKYAKGTISAWEMEVLCFYYHDHELANINQNLYGFADFYALPEDPIVDRTFVKAGKEVKIFKLHRICGTCIAKNKTKGTVTLLTTSGVVNVKFRKEYFSLFDKQISERGEDGVKHVVEKSWFNRGSMVVVTGIRSGDDFVSKKYATTGGHQLYKIETINPDGTLTLRDNRYQGGIEEDAA